MSRNKLTSKCIGENTKILLKSKINHHFLIPPSSSENFFNRFFNFQFTSVSTYMSGLDTV